MLVGVVLVTLAAPAVAGAYVECSYCEAVNRRENEETVRRYEEKEKAAKEQKAAEESRAIEERSQRETAERRHHEEAEQSGRERLEKEEGEEGERKRVNEAAEIICVVPSLSGDSLNGARGALRKAHCELGSVTVAVPRGYHGHGAVVVRGQSIRRGTRHPERTAVAITLGPAKAKSS